MDLDFVGFLKLSIPAVFVGFSVVGTILWMTGKARLYTLLAVAAAMLGLLMVVPGVLHTVAVIGSKLKNNKPYDFRFVSLIATGLILTYVGALNIGISRWIKRGRAWAIAMSAAATFFLCVYLILLQPIKNVRLAIILHGCYLCLLLLQRLWSPASPLFSQGIVAKRWRRAWLQGARPRPPEASAVGGRRSGTQQTCPYPPLQQMSCEKCGLGRVSFWVP